MCFPVKSSSCKIATLLRRFRPYNRQFSLIPSELLGDVLLAIHTTSSLGWGFTIISTTIIFRATLTLPLAMIQKTNQQRLLLLRPLVKCWAMTIQRIKQKNSFNGDHLSSNNHLKHAFSARVSRLQKELNCYPSRDFYLPFIQVPLFISMTAAIRKLVGSPFLWWIDAGEPEGGMSNGGFAWFEDLTTSDPTMITPILCGLFHLFNSESSAKLRLVGQSLPDETGIQKIIMGFQRIGALVMVAISTQAPMAVVLFWSSSAFFSFLQNAVFYYYYSRSSPTRYALSSRIPSS